MWKNRCVYLYVYELNLIYLRYYIPYIIEFLYIVKPHAMISAVKHKLLSSICKENIAWNSKVWILGVLGYGSPESRYTVSQPLKHKVHCSAHCCLNKIKKSDQSATLLLNVGETISAAQWKVQSLVWSSRSLRSVRFLQRRVSGGV